MSTQVALSQEALWSQMEALVSEKFNELIANYVRDNDVKLKELSLIERVVKVEEELKSLKQIELQRHESLVKEMNMRFEAMNERFESLQKEMNTRFESLQKEMNTRFESLQKEMNTRFESLEKRFTFMQWLIASGIALVGLMNYFR